MVKVTVLMPTYNVAPYVKEAIDSVLRQTYSDFELLVIDDCSTDNTVEVVRGIEDRRIRIVQNEKNVGLAENLNRGLNNITTEYVARMDGDDIALPHWLESEISFLETHPDVGVCGGGGVRFGTSNSTIRFPEKHDDIAANMLFHCTIIVPTFRMSLYRDYNLRYRADAFPAEDYRFWADCLRVTKLHNIPDSLFRYRMHPTQICSSRRQEQEGKVAGVRLYMLDWLNSGFTDEEKRYFLDVFQPCRITSKQDIEEMKRFASLLISRNNARNYDNDALHRKFTFHIAYRSLDYVEHAYFPHRYTPLALIRLLASGLYPFLPGKNRRKLISKCLLLKKKNKSQSE